MQRRQRLAAGHHRVGLARCRAGFVLQQMHDGIQRRVHFVDAAQVRVHNLGAADFALGDQARPLQRGKLAEWRHGGLLVVGIPL